jgi:RimJ/RimL family protein N-acetyltransferase
MSAAPHPFADRLTGPRLVLRRFTPADLDAFVAYRSDPDTARWQSWETPYDRELARTFVTEVAAEEPGVPGRAFQYALDRHGQVGLVGDVMLAIRGDRRLAEVGVTLAREARGEGLATEALTVLLDHVLLDPGGVHRVEARCDTRNVRSSALWLRLGFREEAHRLQAAWSKGEWTDELEYGLLAEDWRADRRPG